MFGHFMKLASLRILKKSVLLLLLSLFSHSKTFAQSTVLYSENFNTSKTLGWSGSGDGVGSFSSTIVTSLSNVGFPTAPTSGYLALTADSANKAANSSWWAVQVLANLATPNGLGQTDLSKISFTAKVRAKGLPSTGAVAILKISALGDDPRQPTLGYKRITFEPVLLSGNDWVTIGGTFDDTGLQAAQGSRYNFTTTATSYEILVELSGYNQSTDSGYVAYNSPTGPSNGGRKNPGLTPNAAIRVEFDDVLLTVSNPAAQTTAIGTVSPKSGGQGTSVTITGVAFGSSPTVNFNGTPATSVSVNGGGTSITAVVPASATTGKISVVGSNATASSAYDFFITTPSNLLADPDFDRSQAKEFWTDFEGARIITTSNLAPDATTSWNNIPGAQANTPYMFIPGWEGTPYGGFMQENIPFNRANGDFFTATFQAKFEGNFYADSTIIAFMDGPTTEVATKDIKEEIEANQKIDGENGSWRTYQATFKATPAILSAGRLTLKFQPKTRKLTDDMGSVFVDQVSLTQTDSADIGPQISVKLNAAVQTDNGNTALISPPVGRPTTYSLKLANTGAENLIISSITLSGSSISLVSATLPATITPGGTQTFSIRTTPASIVSIASTLTINSNDKDTADQAFVVNLSTTPVNPTESFNGSETPTQLGWSSVASTEGLTAASSLTTAGGALVLSVDSSADDYPWSYSISKTFASPGALDLSASSLLVALKASGTPSGSGNNKIQVRLESLNNAQAITGSIQLGAWVDETTANSIPNGPFYRIADGINDRVVVYVPENSASYTTVGGSLSSPSTGVNTAFDTSAPYYRLVIQMTDREFDVDAGNLVSIDSITLDLSLKPFSLANGSFESGTYNIPVEITSITDGASRGAAIENWWSGQDIQDWTKLPFEGVKKAVVTNTDTVYNATTPGDIPKIFAPYAGSRAIKVYAQNDYSGGAWTPGPQIGTLYQEYSASSTAGLTPGNSIHARGVAEVFSIDPLTGDSTFNYGFVFVNSSNAEISRIVTTLTSANFTPDKWVPLTVNATIPDGTAKVRIISEFVQKASTDKGSVYLDDLSVGFGTINTSTTVGSSTYPLVWSDEFDGTTLNSANWTPELGGGGWGNNEQQTYTSNSENLSVGGGSLLIQAKKSGTSWTSARIISKDKRSFKYGKIEFRAKLPSGIGPWPAAWMMGNNISSVSWPACGEIDVMEWRGNPTSDANTVGHALHSPSRNGGDPLQPAMRSAVANPSTQFHTYAVLWESDKVTFSVDGVDKAALTPVDQPVFQKEFFLLLNLAMGGNYVGNTIASSLSSASYEVDYVRVYQAASATVTAPAAPALPTFSAVSSTGFTVNWVAVSGATSYRLDVSTSSTFTTFVTQDLTVSGTSQVIGNLSPGTTYYARVRAVNSGGTSTSSTNGTFATLTSYQQFLSGLGYSTSTAFNEDANGDGVKEGIQYAFNGASPRLGTSPATITRSGNTLTYSFDIRNDAALTIVAELSTNLSSWTSQASSVVTNGTGAAAGYTRKIVTITTTEPKAFIRLQVTGN